MAKSQMRLQQFTSRLISEAVSIACHHTPQKNGLRILNYHSVGTGAYRDNLGLNMVTIPRFIEDMDIVAKFHTKSLSPINISQTELFIAISFDDGYADNLYVAAPLLAERGIPFTVFIATDLIQKSEKGFLTPSELKELSITPGVTIGSHGHTHTNLTLCGNRELRSEIEDSKRYLEDLLGIPITKFSYPYGLADMRVRDAVENAGYEVGVSSRFDINLPSRDIFMLNRCVILGSDTSRVVQQKIRGDWDWYRWRSVDPLNIKVPRS
jgi:peptidoglycan/xylan/chitin deacetylase (PgdA/CDA1 family)